MRLRSYLTIAFAFFVACGGSKAKTPATIAPPSPAIAAEEPAPALVAVDIFGVGADASERLLAAHGSDLRRLGEAMISGDHSVDREAILAKVREAGDFAYVEPAFVTYFEDEGTTYYLTIDIVERADAARRMTFLSAPTGEYPDPEGLIADWQTFEAKGMELMGAGTMTPERVDCAAFHCLGDHNHAAVADLVTRFRERAPRHLDELATILRNDRRSHRRAAAAFLLAYTSDGRALVRVLVPALRDESLMVRNNAMRVLAELALHHPEIEIPLEPILDMLEFPVATDRNKAAAVVDRLLARPGSVGLHREVIERAGPTLLAMLRLQQPNNHDFAYSILKRISGKTFGERDYAAWEAWLEQAR